MVSSVVLGARLGAASGVRPVGTGTAEGGGSARRLLAFEGAVKAALAAKDETAPSVSAAGMPVFGAITDGASDVAELVITFYKMYK